MSEGKAASRGDIGLEEVDAELEPDLLSLLTNEEVFDFGMDGRAGNAECGGIGSAKGSGGTGGRLRSDRGAPIGMAFTCCVSVLGACTIEVCGLDADDEDDPVA